MKVLLLRNSTYGLLLLLLLDLGKLFAQAPANLTSNVALTAPTETDFAPSAFFSSTAQIVAAFNKARRTEETQLGLAANSLGNLTLPASYSTLSDNQRALYLINAERTARAGINYGSGAVLGKPLEGVETNLDNTAQGWADYLYKNNLFTHQVLPGGTSPFQRVEATYATNCVQRNSSGQYTMGRSENIYYACGGSATYAVEQAIFSWIYRDSSSSWGHREAVLIQNVDASGHTGYVDDRGATGNEGFLGMGVTTGSSYTACGSNPVRLVVLNIADPGSDASCTFSLENNPLPVSLLYWKGTADEKTVKLEWATSWEKNADYFLIQRSTDLKAFDNVGKVQSKGTTQETQSYAFVDETPALGHNYYRLVQTDLDGSSETSRIISIYRPGNDLYARLAVYPNPVESNAPFRLLLPEKSSVDVRLYNLLGFEVPINLSRANDQELLLQPINTLPFGLYSLVVVKEGQQQQTQLLVK
ncbi:T9SS type A sorting domain-containing protein [Spirosoma aerolatum]|uniref:T9SS type A sorting domain-containing protein n=1 Tax=Spirosoma aerolatum TaxID=1211326 RepID=UPI0009AD2970|nr:T9SS type A sorting domain-containing protein [Spirosoma aerolatum]